MLSPSCVCVPWEMGSERVAQSSVPLTAETALLSLQPEAGRVWPGDEVPALSLSVWAVLHIPKLQLYLGMLLNCIWGHCFLHIRLWGLSKVG